MNLKQAGVEFHISKRRQLGELLAAHNESPELVVITGNSFMQASGDRAFPFQQDSNFFYLTGLKEPEVILVIDANTEYLIVPERSEVRIAFEGVLDTTHMTQVSGIQTILTATEGWKRLATSLKRLKKVATLTPPESYIEHYEMFTNPSRQRLLTRMQAETKSLKIIDVRSHLTNMRMIKSDYEIDAIQQAITKTQRLFEHIESVRPNIDYEHELLAEVSRFATNQQSAYAYDPIIASGTNALTLHYVKNNSKINKKSTLLLDIGLTHNGYAADITRTVSYAPNKRQGQLFSAVSEVHAYAVSLLKPGITIKEYEELVFQHMGEQLQKLGLINEITKESVREFYPHSTSHFLGIDVHDVGDYQKPLAAGMVLTVEPGIYSRQDQVGIRLEDDVLITKDGCKVLSDALPKNLSSLTISTNNG
ncbi:MAG: aminopeptidase P N-terminal domain-containing protein [Candidatus Saccharimonadales bacterium]